MPAKRKSTGKKSSGSSRKASSRRFEFAFAEEGQLFIPRLPQVENAGAEALESFQVEEDYSDMLESICGATDDSQPVEQYDGSLGVTVQFVNANQGPVGQLQWNNNLATIYTNPGNVNGVRWATGTLLENNLFLTAGHNFDSSGGGWDRPKKNGTSTTISPAEIAKNMHVNFNYQVDPNGVLRTETQVPIVELLEHRLGGLDYAIVRLGGNAAATFGTGRIANANAVKDDVICIMGHPMGVPKRVEAGKVFSVGGDAIRYDDIDTLGGNSGSGILRASDGRIVGVHTNGGCNPQGTGQNRGFPIAAIIAVSPVLQGLLNNQTTTSVAADVNRTTVTQDVATTAITDRTTTVTLDVATTVIRDVRTSLVRDTLLPGGGRTSKALDDVKRPALDKQFSDRKIPGLDAIDPFGGFGRPFALATPHHIEFAGSEAESAQVEYETAIAQLQQLIEQTQSELAALEEHYQRLVQEYQELTGGS